ncbi:MAG TPA: diaminobutyrate acetyltransferase [Sandaracinaceae bacterium LLY-WYZ-13_1]|nr:diaminobutyrate acetyltransferase [Sandaracinaceae bacterium LLY-WYZ-13_1]
MSHDERNDELVIRRPEAEDGAALWELVEDIGVLDLNSPYAYLLVARHLAATSAVAEMRNKLVGFVSGYRPPIHDDVLFVWQVGVHPDARGLGLARRMILDILDREEARGVRWIESTVTTDNIPSQRLFRSLARHLDTEIAVSPYFSRDLFPDERPGTSEELHRIGPIDRRAERDEARGVDSAAFKRLESVVRTECRSFPTVFDAAEGHVLTDERGRDYLDFTCGGGVTSYGHNEPRLRSALIEHLERGAINHGQDLYTTVKRRFLERVHQVLLEPRGLDYRIMFPGPSSSGAVEAAVKLARKVTRRDKAVAFTHAYHGPTHGALELSADRMMRRGAGVPLEHVERMPYCGYHGADVDTADILRRSLADVRSGFDKPAAIVVETVQAEGGVHVASDSWLQKIEALAREFDVLLIVDESQTGCGRTGPFFGFEHAGIEPDMVVLSNALSGYGLPLSVVLARPEHDVWIPGEHVDPFRGLNAAMVTATASLDFFWADQGLSDDVTRKGAHVRARLEAMAESTSLDARVRGRGLLWGLDLGVGTRAREVSRECFERGLLVETCGSEQRVLKVMPPLTIDDGALDRGLDLLAEALEAVTGR